MQTQLGKWGNSLGVRIPGSLARELGLHDGSEVDLENVAGVLVVRPLARKRPKYDLEELLDQMTPESVHEATDWGTPQGKEEW